MKKFDAIIIGSGQAGNPLAKRIADQLRETIFTHPTFAESLNNLFMNLDK